jgi:hypothetical protein
MLPALSAKARRIPIHRKVGKLHIFRGMGWLGGCVALGKLQQNVLWLTHCPHIDGLRVLADFGLSNICRNVPFAIANYYAIVGVFRLLMTAIFVNSAEAP